MRPLQNAPFCPISVSDSNFNPQNTQCIPVVKIFVFLELEPRLNIKTYLTGQAKLSIFQRSQYNELFNLYFNENAQVNNKNGICRDILGMLPF